MPKSVLITPEDVKARGKIDSVSIPLNQYNKSFTDEIEHYGADRLIDMYYTMRLIRCLELALDVLKIEGSYKGMEYNHPGAAHISVGQEAPAVGQGLVLDADDMIFGSHRSHGEIIAKCFSAIRQTDENALQGIMESFLDGKTLSVVERHLPTEQIGDMAENFILYGILAEIFGRSTGFNCGMGGSMHTFFVPFGCMPNNAIVGGSTDLAVGAALFKKINRRKGIVIANMGDGAMGCGPVWEALCIASMDQYTTLWDELPGAPPFMLNIQNNFYGMGGQTKGETMGFVYPARIGAGVNPLAMHSERVDGMNPLAVADAVSRKKQCLLEGRGPVLLETVVYRHARHSQSDQSSYRTKEEVDAFIEHDCIRNFEASLLEHGLITSSYVDELTELLDEKIAGIMHLAIDEKISPREDERFIENVMFSNARVESYSHAEPDVLLPLEENPRLQQIAKKHRFALNEEGKPHPATKVYAIRDAIFDAMIHRFYKDPTMVAYGEENRDWGGAFACYRGLTEALPYHRLFNTAISEGAIVGSGVGYALSGGRAVVELMYCDFLGRAGDEVFNQMPKWQSMSGGILHMPLILRMSVGNKYGAQHSQDWTSIVTHIPGLQVMYPVSPYDARGMLNTALAGSDPVLFFECQRLYGQGELFHPGGVPTEYYEIELGEPDIKRAGGDVTICTIGRPLYEAVAAAEILSAKYGVEAEIIDLRFLNPLNYEPIIQSVKKTGRVIIVSDACERASFSHTVASNLNRYAFTRMDAPAVVLGARNWIVPSAELEEVFFPQADWIIDAIHEEILPLPGHTPRSIQSSTEMIRRNRMGC